MRLKFLPFKTLHYQTKSSPQEVLDKIQEYVVPKKYWRWDVLFGQVSGKLYQGEIGNDSFKIERVIGYQNSFLPTIVGKVESDFNGTSVKIKMRLNWFVFVFLCFWCSFVAFAFFAVFVIMIGREEFQPVIFIPVGMLLFAYGLTRWGFNRESKESEKFFDDLFLRLNSN